MPKSRRAKACDIPQSVKMRVWERDGGRCIICGNPHAAPNAHYIRRSQGGLGIEENIVTLCLECHEEYDNGSKRKEYGEKIRKYLKDHYPGWDESKLIYRKWG
jgi:predicted CXXCH cytochrome family protein